MPIISNFPTRCSIGGSASKVLNENSWEVIRAVSDNNQGENYWAIGDTKEININGKIGVTAFSNLKLDAFIIGFNHNVEKEGNGKIHFLIGKHNGKMVGICDDRYNPNSSQNVPDGYFCMNPSSNQTNSGGWEASYMRKLILGGDRNPNSPTENTLLAALPADLRSVMKPVTKYSDNTAGGGGDQPNFITATTDYLFLLSEFEVTNGRSSANIYEQFFQRQYQFFEAGNSKFAYKYNDIDVAVTWALRSAYYRRNSEFCNIATYGHSDIITSDASTTILAGFVV